MSFFLAPVIALYDYALRPVPPLAWLGVPATALDIVGALRLAVALRQLREGYYEQYVSKAAPTGPRTRSGAKSGGRSSQRAASDELSESRSRVREFIATLVMVHGGEAIVAPWLGLQPSFIISKTSSLLFLSAQVLVDLLPAIPTPSLQTEVPLTIVHACFRTTLLCNVVPRVVAGHASPTVAASSFTLLLAAWIMPNGGPFISNLFSLLRPTPIELATPPELLPYGWTATDFWAAPFVTGLYATLTHAQPFFAYIHSLLYVFFWPFGLAPLTEATPKTGLASGHRQHVVAAVDHQAARAVCAIVLCALNVNRAMRAYGPGYRAMITQLANAVSSAKPLPKALPAPSAGEDEKSEHSPEEDSVESVRKGRAESTASKGKSDARRLFGTRSDEMRADHSLSDAPKERRSSRHLRRRLPA